jgi:hypothetical protein
MIFTSSFEYIIEEWKLARIRINYPQSRKSPFWKAYNIFIVTTRMLRRSAKPVTMRRSRRMMIARRSTSVRQRRKRKSEAE